MNTEPTTLDDLRERLDLLDSVLERDHRALQQQGFLIAAGLVLTEIVAAVTMVVGTIPVIQALAALVLISIFFGALIQSLLPEQYR